MWGQDTPGGGGHRCLPAQVPAGQGDARAGRCTEQLGLEGILKAPLAPGKLREDGSPAPVRCRAAERALGGTCDSGESLGFGEREESSAGIPRRPAGEVGRAGRGQSGMSSAPN